MGGQGGGGCQHGFRDGPSAGESDRRAAQTKDKQVRAGENKPAAGRKKERGRDGCQGTPVHSWPAGVLAASPRPGSWSKGEN